MNKIAIFAFALSMSLSMTAFAIEKEGKKETEKEKPVYLFTDTKTIPVTPVKNQASSGTCWCFATMGMIEADVLKEKGKTVDLSEMWVVRHTYFDKVLKYVRMHGATNLGPGGAAHDVPNAIRKYGIVPEEVYTGLNYGTTTHKHGELDNAILAYAKTIVGNPNGKLSEAWINGLNGILDAYFGPLPKTFTVEGKTYTPQSYAQELGINPDDYISVTSYTHHPFGTSFPIEVPDNWAWDYSVNVPLDEFMKISEEVLNGGYTISWGSDVSDKGFKYKEGFAVLPEEVTVKAENGSDQIRWTGASGAKIEGITEPIVEATVTQESRQKDFDNYVSTDDHGMLILGMATAQNGAKFFKVKNSWGESNPMKGYFYVSYPFYKARTINILFNKKALPVELQNKLK